MLEPAVLSRTILPSGLCSGHKDSHRGREACGCRWCVSEGNGFDMVSVCRIARSVAKAGGALALSNGCARNRLRPAPPSGGMEADGLRRSALSSGRKADEIWVGDVWRSAHGWFSRRRRLAFARHPWPPPADGMLANDPTVVWGELPNGVRYAVMPGQTPPGKVSLRLVIEAGSLMESEQQRGLAHFLEHMAFKGSTNLAPGEFVSFLQRAGWRSARTPTPGPVSTARSTSSTCLATTTRWWARRWAS